MYIREIILAISGISISAIISFVLFYFSHKLAIKKFNLLREDIEYSRNEKYKEGRPRVELKSMWFDTEEVDLYVGSNMKGWFAKPIDGKDPNTGERIGEDFTDIVTDNNKLYKNTRLRRPGNKKYMFINLLTPSAVEENIDDVILAFDILKLVLYVGDTIREVKIERAYSMRNSEEHFANGLGINARFQNPSSLFEIPIAYACVNGSDMSVHLNNIHNSKKEAKASGIQKSIDLLKENKNVKEFISFSETAYDLRFETYAEKYYNYTIFLKVDGRKHLEHVEEYGSELFNKLIQGREHIVQYAIDYESDKKNK